MLNLLDHPVCLSWPLRLAATAWAEHVPFAMFLVDALRPATIVELGTYSGVSYCAFCQSVAKLGLDSRCYAVDTWEGDDQSGFFGPEVLEDLKRHHDPLYGGFSTLIQSTFDQAAGRFDDSTLDLLHIDGHHAYASVKRDFETWLPKMSKRGVILFHDTNERHDNFEVWKIWEELKPGYPNFEFMHGHGLGVLAVGDTYPPKLLELFNSGPDERALIAEMFQRLGERLSLRLDADHTAKALSWQVNDKQQIIEGLSEDISDRERSLAERDEAVRWLRSELNQLETKAESLSTLIGTIRDEKLGLQAVLKQLESKVKELSTLVAREREDKSSLAAKLDSHAQLIDQLRDELTAAKGDYSVLSREFVDKTAKSEKTIRDRDLAIDWLRSEIANLQSNNRILAEQLSAQTAKLDRISSSAGWRLLNRYGRIKYRYLLPAYRMLGKDPRAGRPAEVASAEDVFINEVAIPQSQEFTGGSAPSELEWGQERLAQNGFYQSLTLLPQPLDEELNAFLSKKSSTTTAYRHDVVCFSIIDWEFRYQRPQQIMSQFAANGHRVFYISTSRRLPSDSSPRVRVTSIKENVYEIQLATEHLPDVYGEVINHANKLALMKSLDELRRVFHINEAVAYVMISSWTAVALEARELWGWRLIYDCMDEWKNFPGIKRALLDAEVKLVTECDLLVVTAQRLWAKWKEYNRPMVLARNGVDCEFYAKHYFPNTLVGGVKHPVIGYFGAIADWFYVDLLRHVAEQRPDYTFVLLGGVFDIDVSALKALPNVLLLGQQPYETMPQYLYHFDVCMIPFKINKITEATDPVKVYEYLSAGKPVVSVALPELDSYRAHLYIAADENDFVTQLDRAVAEDDEEAMARRIQFAQMQTWHERYKQIEAGIESVTPPASIIVVTYNNLALNKLCLESILRNTDYPNYEVVVVDNNSTDGTPGYLRYLAAQHAHLKVILNPDNAGFARANNQGIAKSKGDFIVLLNNDTVVPPGWLSRLLKYLADPSVGIVGPLTNFVGNEAKIDVPYQTVGEMEDFAFEHTWKREGMAASIKVLAMFCVAFRRETYELIGPLDEQFGIGMFEDDDYTLRMKAAGLQVICAADVFVHHVGQAAFKKLIRSGEYNRLFDENRRRYEEKWTVEGVPHKQGELDFEQKHGRGKTRSDGMSASK